MKQPLAITYSEHGTPGAVLSLESVAYRAPGEGEVAVRLLASVVHPSDLGIIQGSYGRLKTLPAVAGREGVGEVIALGTGVEGYAVGDWVRMPEALGCWQQVVTASVASLLKMPNDLPLEQAAMAFVNPGTAIRLLRDFQELQPGDWVIQNAANSAVGFAVVQYARRLGYRTLNVVRDLSWESALKDAGADVVVAEGTEYFKEVQALTGGARPKLGLNSIGGNSVGSLIKAMGESGMVVTFGGMVGDPVRFPTRFLIFNDLTLKGFWMDRWLREQEAETLHVFYEEIFSLIRQGVFVLPVDRVFDFAQGLEAVSRASEPGRRGKVLIRSDWSF